MARPFFLSPAFCAHNGVLPIESGPDRVALGLLDPENSALRRRIENAWPGITFSYSPMDRGDFALALSRLFAEDGDDTGASVAGGDGIGASRIDNVESGAPIVNLLNSIFLEASALRASDVHLESESGRVALRYRIDGRLRVMANLTVERGAALSARLKHLANLNIVERRRPQDGRIELAGPGRGLSVRVSIVPTVKGESVVLRVLGGDDAPLSLDSLGFSPGELGRIRAAIRQTSGLILVTGPTGSGKTTTLSAILRELRDDETKIVSIEDPVEYRLDGVTQIQTDDALALTFDSLLRRIFRQDPDVVMVGEIRDGETAALAVRAALTGHLVFATLHSTGALEAIPRLINLGVEPYLLAETLRLSVAQRLLRRKCERCRGSGCDACGRTGYSGRVAVSESVFADGALRRALEAGYCRDAVAAAALRAGFVPLREDALMKAASGVTDGREVLRELGR